LQAAAVKKKLLNISFEMMFFLVILLIMICFPASTKRLSMKNFIWLNALGANLIELRTNFID